jgi:hypothetical protein
MNKSNPYIYSPHKKTLPPEIEDKIAAWHLQEWYFGHLINERGTEYD